MPASGNAGTGVIGVPTDSSDQSLLPLAGSLFAVDDSAPAAGPLVYQLNRSAGPPISRARVLELRHRCRGGGDRQDCQEDASLASVAGRVVIR